MNDQEIHEAVIDGFCCDCKGYIGCEYLDSYNDCDGYLEEYKKVKNDWELEE